MENALITGRTSNTEGRVEGRRVRLMMQAVGPRFFETMKMRLLAGRGIAAADGPGAPDVAVINEAAARTLFPGRSPIGRTFAALSGREEFRTLEIVGVVADSHYGSLRAAAAADLLRRVPPAAGRDVRHVLRRPGAGAGRHADASAA